jgi:hypothetical protein
MEAKGRGEWHTPMFESSAPAQGGSPIGGARHGREFEEGVSGTHIGGSSPRHPRMARRREAMLRWARRSMAPQGMEGGWMVAPEFDSPAPTRGASGQGKAWLDLAGRREVWHGRGSRRAHGMHRGSSPRSPRSAGSGMAVRGLAGQGMACHGGAREIGGRVAHISVRVADVHAWQRSARRGGAPLGRTRRGAAVHGRGEGKRLGRLAATQVRGLGARARHRWGKARRGMAVQRSARRGKPPLGAAAQGMGPEGGRMACTNVRAVGVHAGQCRAQLVAAWFGWSRHCSAWHGMGTKKTTGEGDKWTG